MNRKIALVFLMVGLVLLVLGACAYHSNDSAVSRVVMRGSTDAPLGFIISGLLAAITGVFGLDDNRSKQS